MNTNNVPALVTAPNKTLTAPPPTSRRHSNTNTNSKTKSNSNNSSSNTSPLPRSPSLELSDSFSALSALSPTSPNQLQHQQQQLQLHQAATAATTTNKYNLGSHHNKLPTEQHQPQQQYSQFFSASQLASIKPICSVNQVNNFSFLLVEKYPASHNS
jgi:hypothetical protein